VGAELLSEPPRGQRPLCDPAWTLGPRRAPWPVDSRPVSTVGREWSSASGRPWVVRPMVSRVVRPLRTSWPECGHELGFSAGRQDSTISVSAGQNMNVYAIRDSNPEPAE